MTSDTDNTLRRKAPSIALISIAIVAVGILRVELIVLRRLCRAEVRIGFFECGRFRSIPNNSKR